MGSTKFTALDLELLGMEETFPGSGIYEKKKADKHKTIGFDIDKQVSVLSSLNTLGRSMFFKPVTPDSFDGDKAAKVKLDHVGLLFPLNVDIDMPDITGLPEKTPQEWMEDFNQKGFYLIDSKTHDIPSGRRTEPFPIAEIRLLTGKKRDVAVAELQEEAKRFVQGIGITEIYIPTNVASSKNSKQLFKTGKKNATVTRDKEGNTNTTIKETSFITDSQVSKAYRKETANSWVTNRLKFSSALQGLNKPYSIELTFIRTTLGRFDFHNMAQLPFDLMVEHGWIVDDESAEVVPVFNKCVYYSKYFSGLVIRVIK